MAAIGLLSNGVGNLAAGNSFFKGGLQAAAFGAIGGSVSAGIGTTAQGLANGGASQLGVAAFQAGAHAISGGALSAAQGGSFWSGAASGALSSAVGSGIAAIDGGGLAQWIGGGLSGGAGSYIAGGGFWSGVGQGLTTGGLNHAADQIHYQLTKARLVKLAKKAGFTTESEIGRYFEALFYDWAEGHSGIQGIRSGELIKTVFGNTIPDFFSDGIDQYGKTHPGSVWWEVKGKSGGVYQSSQDYQIFKQLFALGLRYSGEGSPLFNLVTTSDVGYSGTTANTAALFNVRYNHLHGYYTGSLRSINVGFKHAP